MTPLLSAFGVGMEGRLSPSDLIVNAGTLTGIVGPNGGGKTSLLRSLARIDQPLGQVWIEGEDVDQAAPARRRSLLSFLPAAREVAWPIVARDVISLGLVKPDAARVDELVHLLELDGLAARPIDRLSTGERARVLLARALAPQPKVLLLDEPLSNLDPYWALRILEIVAAIARQGSAVLISLHDLRLLERVDRGIVVAGGRIVGDEDPEDLLRGELIPATFRIRLSRQSWQIA